MFLVFDWLMRLVDLRRKLQAIGARELIHTVRGVGYVMREP